MLRDVLKVLYMAHSTKRLDTIGINEQMSMTLNNYYQFKCKIDSISVEYHA